MARDIFQITEQVITFVGDKGEEVSGDSADCRMVGGKYISDGRGGGTCYLKNVEFSNSNFTNNRNVIGQGNTIHSKALNNNVTGDYNTIGNVSNTNTVGKFAKTTRHGEFTRANASALGRSQKSVLFYEGVTNSSVSAPEIFLEGITNKRLEVDESFGMSTIALDIHTVAKYTDAGNDGSGYLHSKAVFQSTGGVLAINGRHTSIYEETLVIGNLTLAAVSGTPDYISFTLSGDRSGRSMAWSVIVNVYEIRTEVV
tara:strand:+ start:5544 stop:6311 length:768 start_codon:yes stop_codon:yes gene_type:complete